MHTARFPEELDAVKAAATAGARAIAGRGRDVGAIRVKGAATDVVTDTDIAAGVAVVQSILAHDPAARVVIEEPEVYGLTGVAQGELSDREVWLIDPLDGTTSFVHGFPCYSVSVALLRDGEPIAGAVYHVVAEELFSAAKGTGAFLGDERISCTAVEKVTDALLITGFPYDRGALLDRQLDVLGRFLRTPVHGIRRDGSAAIDCCQVACGRADGFWEFGLQPWDVGAGAIILREAGAQVTGVEAERWTPASTGIIAANPVLHDAIARIVVARA